jgi:hypothetical protein
VQLETERRPERLSTGFRLILNVTPPMAGVYLLSPFKRLISWINGQTGLKFGCFRDLLKGTLRFVQILLFENSLSGNLLKFMIYCWTFLLIMINI